MRRASALARGIIWLGSLFAPAGERARLRREWGAELAHRRQRESRASEFGLGLWALGVVPHALYLRRRSVGMAGWTEDLGQAWRSVRRRPGPALVAIIVLALGIGASAAVLSVADAVMFRPFPLPDGERLVRVYGVHRALGMDRSSVSYPDFADMRGSNVLEGASIYSGAAADLAGEGLPERVRVAIVNGDFFDVLRAEAERGRLLGPSDDALDAPRVVVLSHDVWASRYGADPDVVGRTVRLDGVPHTVVGVVRPEHAWPLRGHPNRRPVPSRRPSG